MGKPTSKKAAPPAAATSKAAAAAAAAAPSSWDAAAWSGSSDSELHAWLTRHLADAHETDNHLTLTGPPLAKDAALTHWGNLSSFFNEGDGGQPIRSMAQLERLLRALDKNKGAKDVPIFFFEKIVMQDEEEEWEVGLGSHVLINEPKHDGADNWEDDYYVARITHIAFTAAGDRIFGVQWLYRIQDTPLAVSIKVPQSAGSSGKGGKRKPKLEEEAEKASLAKVLPVSGEVFPRSRVWLCGSDVDNKRYNNEYNIDLICDPVRVCKVPPGMSTAEEVQALIPAFNPEKEYWYNGHTQVDFHAFEDMHLDVTPWSEGYRKVLATHGLKGIQQLRGSLSKADPEGGFKRLMSLSRGTTDPDLAPLLACVQETELGSSSSGAAAAAVASSSGSNSHSSRVKRLADKIQAIRQEAEAESGTRMMRKLELFCGGGGLSFMAQSDPGVQIVSCWANDINPSACSTYVCNKTQAIVSCCGLEELSQLHRHWFDLVQLLLGEGWADLPQLRDIILLPPGKRYSRPHMPEGIGCGGGLDPDEAWHAIYPARKGQEAREALGPLLLSLAGKSHQQVRAFLEQRQREGQGQGPKSKAKGKDGAAAAAAGAAGADAEPEISEQQVESLLRQARHYKAYADRRAAREAALPKPDFEACLAALPEVKLLADDLTARSSSSGSSKKDGSSSSAKAAAAIESHATKLLAVLLPRVPTAARLDAARASEVQGHGKHDVTLKQRYAESYKQQLGEVAACLKARLDRKLGEVLEVRDVRVRDCARRCSAGNNKKQTPAALAGFECWLEFEVKRQGSEAWRWEHQALLQTRGAVTPMRRFMLAMIADKTIPLPGDVDVMTGGPPCQNMSGLNRQARQEDVMNDPKNRLVACYMGTIEHLQPSYLLIEQVTDIYKKEEALYARFTVFSMLQHGYQARAGILTAGNYGTPEGRLRAIFWGAKSGSEQLPPFPAATHQCKDHGIGFPKAAPYSKVGPLPESQEGVQPLFPFHVWGDVTSDLPPVENYSELERLSYASQPQTYLQQWLRRDPPVDEPPLLMRAVHADAAMKAWGPTHSRDKAAAIINHTDPDWESKVMAAGLSALCNTCMWMTSLSTDQVLKIAAETRSRNKAAALEAASTAATDSAAAAAAAAAAGTAEGAAGGEGGQDEEEQEDAAELAVEMGQEGRFMPQVQRKLIEESSRGDAKKALLVAWNAQAAQHAVVAHTGLKRIREQLKAQSSLDVLCTLRDHRPHTCNIDDWLRMVSLPREPGVCFRDLQGVVTNADKTCCAGCWHACSLPATDADKKLLAERVAQFRSLPLTQQAKLDPMEWVYRGVNLTSGCEGGGNNPKPPSGLFAKTGNDKKYRVDSYGVRVDGTRKPGCPSRTLFLGSNGLLCPRWCVTYNNGKSIGRNGCFGRISPDIVQPTVVTRPEPHNLQLVHHEEDRVLTVREDARCQAFPDHHVFIGLNAGAKSGSGKGLRIVAERYLQIGNAVAPPMASALGRCLLLAAAKKAPVSEPVVYSADPDFTAAVQDGSKGGCVFYSKANNVSQRAPDNWARYPQVASGDKTGGKRRAGGAKAAAAAAGGSSLKAGADSAATEAPAAAAAAPDKEGDAAAAAGAGGGAGGADAVAENSVPAPKRRKTAGSSKKKPAAGAAAGAAADAAAEGGAAGAAAAAAGGVPEPCEVDSPLPAHKSKKKRKQPAAAAAGAEVEHVGDGAAAAAAGGGAGGGSSQGRKKHRNEQQQQRRQQPDNERAAPAAAAAAAAAAGDETDTNADSDQTVAAAGAGGGSKLRPVRAQAAATAAAIRESLRRDNDAAPF